MSDNQTDEESTSDEEEDHLFGEAPFTGLSANSLDIQYELLDDIFSGDFHED